MQVLPPSEWISWRNNILPLPPPPAIDDSSLPFDEVDAIDSALSSVSVAAAVKDPKELLPTGVVVRVIQSSAREKDIIAGIRGVRQQQILKSADAPLAAEGAVGKEEYVLVVPMDRSLPKIRICTRQKAFLAGKKIVVNIDHWNRDSMYPNGHISRYISGGSDFETEISALLMEHSISIRPFSVAALSLLPPVDSLPPREVSGLVSGKRIYDSQWRIDEAELRSRRDYRTTRQVFRYSSIS